MRGFSGVCIWALALVIGQGFSLQAQEGEAEAGPTTELAEFKPFASLQSELSYQSNVSGNAQGQGSTVLRFGPSVGLRRAVGLWKGTLSASTQLEHYFEQDEFSGLDASLATSLSGPDRAGYPWRLTINGSYFRDTGIDDDAANLVQASSYGLGVSTSYRYSPRLSLTGSLRGNFRDVETAGFVDTYQYGGGGSASYSYSRKLSLSAGFDVGTSSSTATGDAAQSNRTLSLFTGVSGQLQPKVSGSLSLGLSTQHIIEGQGSDNLAPYLSAGLNWRAAQRTQVSLNAQTRASVSSTNQSTTSQTLSLGLNQGITSRLGASASASYTHSELRGTQPRTDDRLRTSLGLSYQLNRHLSLGTRIGLDQVYSTRQSTQYTSYNAAVSASWQL
jgi:hypothetical protein